MLNERIENDLKDALKQKDAIKVSTIRFLKAALQNARIEKQKDLQDDDIVAIIKKQIKQRQDSIAEFKKGNRQDLVDKEAKELELLKAYLPEELKPEEVIAIVKQVISEVKPASIKDTGRVMKEVMAKVKSRADGSLISKIVKEELTKIGGTGSQQQAENK
jgi:uncharacterized protein YqeY